MSLEYIRKTYKVPAKRGGRVEYLASDGDLMEGTITGAVGAYLRVRLDGNKHSGRYHPTWALKYLPNGPTFERNDCDWPLCTCQPHDCCEGMEALCKEPKPSDISSPAHLPEEK